MTEKNLRADRGRRAKAASVLPALLGLLPAMISAQVAPTAPATSGTSTEAPLQLSVFEVSATADVGYQAGNTTSGSRLNTSLKDTAAAVMVFTPEFMSDFNTNSLADIIGYSPNMQIDMLDTAADANPQFVGGSDLFDTRIRVRGLSASTALDFFETNIAIDTYNTERLELSSGPNSILFGFGQSGGLVNIMTKSAQLLRNRTAIRAQFGQWNFARYELDHNQIIIKDKLAVRLNGLQQWGGGWRKHEYNDSSRGAISVRAAPWRKTTLTAGYENGEMNGSVARPLNAFDNIALWQASGSPTKADAAWTAADRALGLNRRTAVRNAYYTGTDGAAPFVLTSSNVVNFRVLESTYENNNIPADDRAGLTLTPREQFPFDYNSYGPGTSRDTNLKRVIARLEQRVTETFSVELAYNNEYSSQLVQTPQGNQVLYGGDPNTVIPNPDGSATPIPNARAGDLFVEGRWVGDRGETKNEVFRASAAWEVDLGKFGLHKLAALGEHGVFRAYRYPQSEILVDDNNVPLSNVALPENAANHLWRRHYVTPGDYSTYHPGNVTEPVTVVRNGRTFHNTYIDGSIAGGDIERTMNTVLAATQSRFFDSRFVFTGGVRWDRIRLDQYGDTRLDATHPDVVAGRKILNTVTFIDEIEDTTRFGPVTSTLGGVYHVTPQFSVFYNRANNNGQPKLNIRVLPDETLPEPSKGESDDYGFMLNLLDGKIFLRATAYETTQRKAAGGTFVIGLRGGENDLVGPSTRILDTLLANNRINEAEYLDHAIGDEANLSGSSDVHNEGYELSTWFNINRNLTGVFNFSYTKTDRSSVVPEFEGWYERERAFWNATPGAGALVNPEVGTTIASEEQGLLDTIQGVREFYGFGYGERPYKANISGRYSLTEGRLKGAFAGMGLRWQGKSKLGRYITGRDAKGFRIFGDTIYGPEDFKMDAFLGYRRRLSSVAGKPQLLVQLNVSNLTDEDEFMPLRYNPLVSGYSRVLLLEPRKFRVTVGLEF
ncbi:MAG: TonB-dependent receptor plug domain-containing protein [Opitutaceae bacterium]|nr:TonB-dependent receptor plug domain-containing protein [Opitutaceae bacterium]